MGHKRMQLPADTFVDDFTESALICRMDVLIAILRLKGAGSPFLSDFLEASFDFGKFEGCQDAALMIGPCKGNAAIDVLSPEPCIIGKRFVVLHEKRILSAC